MAASTERAPRRPERTTSIGGRLRPALAVVAVAAVVLLAAGCGGGASPGVANVGTTLPSASGSTGATQAEDVLLAGRCLRQNGLADMPDPMVATDGPAKGQEILDKQSLHSFTQSVVNHAMLVCNSLLEELGIGNGANDRTPQEIQDGLAFARCVRSHGISNFPDPTARGQFDLAGTGINQHDLTPAQLAAAKACLSVAHGVVHLPQQGGSG